MVSSLVFLFFFFFKQKTAYELRIIDWSSDVCSSDLVALDLAASAGLADPLPAWRSATTPSCGDHMVAPGAVALEAAAITVTVLVAVGDRDVVPDPWMEPKALKSAHDVSVCVCHRMEQLHNFDTKRKTEESREGKE